MILNLNKCYKIFKYKLKDNFMNRHLSMRSGNPALNKNTFLGLSGNATQCMTIDGTVNKTFISLILLFLSAIFSWNHFSSSIIIVGFICGLITAIITIYKKQFT